MQGGGRRRGSAAGHGRPGPRAGRGVVMIVTAAAAAAAAAATTITTTTTTTM